VAGCLPQDTKTPPVPVSEIKFWADGPIVTTNNEIWCHDVPSTDCGAPLVPCLRSPRRGDTSSRGSPNDGQHGIPSLSPAASHALDQARYPL
jgi:hypothetical protein